MRQNAIAIHTFVLVVNFSNLCFDEDLAIQRVPGPLLAIVGRIVIARYSSRRRESPPRNRFQA